MVQRAAIIAALVLLQKYKSPVISKDKQTTTQKNYG